MDANSFIFYIKPEEVYCLRNNKDVERSFGTSNYQLRRVLPKGNMKTLLDY